MAFKAYIRFEENGEDRLLRVFPRSKKVHTFRTQDAAQKALERKTSDWKRPIKCGHVVPAGFGAVHTWDWSRVFNVAL